MLLGNHVFVFLVYNGSFTEPTVRAVTNPEQNFTTRSTNTLMESSTTERPNIIQLAVGVPVGVMAMVLALAIFVACAVLCKRRGRGMLLEG